MTKPKQYQYFSKTRLLSAYVCLKKAYLEKHRPELKVVSAKTQTSFDIGNAVGAIAQDIYGTEGSIEIPFERPMSKMVKDTAKLIASGFREPIFEATFQHQGVLVRVDALIPDGDGWRAVEVKASGSVKPEHHVDCAAQLWVMRGVGIQVNSIALGHIDTSFVYQGDGDYSGLIKEEDLTEIATAMEPNILDLLANATVAVSGEMPEVPVGRKCTDPYECAFRNFCWPMDGEFPTSTIGGNKDKIIEWVNRGITDVRNIPASEITAERQQMVHRVASAGEPDITPGAYAEIEARGHPRYHLDFETANPAIPLWKGSRPYQIHAVQFSVHVDDGKGDGSFEDMPHFEFLDLSGDAPMRPLAEKLIEVLGDSGPVMMVSHYEKTTINGLIKLFPDLEPQLQAIINRLFDIQKVVKAYYYHPKMLGSYSLKAVAPLMSSKIDYKKLEGISEGGAAAAGYVEAVNPETTPEEKARIEAELLKYCRVDTEAMAEIVKYFKDLP